MLQVVVPIWLQNLEIWEKRHTCELVGKRKSPKRQKVFCHFADVPLSVLITSLTQCTSMSRDPDGTETVRSLGSGIEREVVHNLFVQFLKQRDEWFTPRSDGFYL